jgi:hypothetical protein
MKKPRYTDTQNIVILKQDEAEQDAPLEYSLDKP